MCDVMARAPTLGFLSKITVRWSARAVYKAQQQPAGPPPTIATSHSTSSIILSWVRRVWRSGRLDSVRASEHLHTANSKARRLGGAAALLGLGEPWRGAARARLRRSFRAGAGALLQVAWSVSILAG